MAAQWYCSRAVGRDHGVHYLRTGLKLLLLATLVSAWSCEDDIPSGDDDTVADPEPSPCDEGSRQDPDLPAEFLDDFPDRCVPQSCGIGRWGDLKVDEDTVYVDTHAAEGGNGAADAPFDRIQAGLDAAGDGLVAVAAGTYQENLVLTEDQDGVHLAGRCQELVLLDASAGEEGESGIQTGGGFAVEGDWGVSRITVAGAPYAGVWLSGGHLSVDRALITGNHEVGIVVGHANTHLILQDVVVRDTVPDEEGAWGRGIDVEVGASIDATDCLIEGNADVGVFLRDAGTVARFVRVEVRDTRPMADGTGGRGIEVQQGASLSAATSLVEGNADVGIYVGGEGSSVSLFGVDVSHTHPRIDGTGGRGISAEDGATLRAVGCSVDQNTDIGISASGAGATVYLAAVQIRETQPEADGTDGWGLGAQRGALLRAENCLVEHNSDVGIFVGHEGTAAHLSNVEVLDTRLDGDGARGRGIEVNQGAVLSAENCRIANNSEAGFFAADEGTIVSLDGVDVQDTQPVASGALGWGIVVQTGASLEAKECRIEGNTEIGITLIGEGTTATLSNVDVVGTQPNDDLDYGRGIQLQAGPTLWAENCLVEGNSEVGVFVNELGSVAYLDDVEVRETRPRADGTLGRGIVIQHGASLYAEDSVFDSNAEIGIFANYADTVLLENVEVNQTCRASNMTVATGVVSQRGSTVIASDVVVTETEGVGLYASSMGTLTCTGCEIGASAFAGAIVMGGSDLHLSDSTISDTTADANEGGGIGIYASEFIAPCGLTVENTTIEGQPLAAVWLDGAGSYSIRDSTLVGGYGMELVYPDGSTAIQHGDAVVAAGGVTAWDGTSGLLLGGNHIRDAIRAGLFLDASSATLQDNTFTDNTTDLVWQDCEGVLEPQGLDGVSTVDYCPDYNHHVVPLEFDLYLAEVEPLE